MQLQGTWCNVSVSECRIDNALRDPSQVISWQVVSRIAEGAVQHSRACFDWYDSMHGTCAMVAQAGVADCEAEEVLIHFYLK